MPNSIKIRDPEIFKTLPVEQQRLVFFENLIEIQKHFSEQVGSCNDRFKKIEKRRWWNTAASGIGGVIGGFVAMVARAFLSR